MQRPRGRNKLASCRNRKTSAFAVRVKILDLIFIPDLGRKPV